MEMNANMMDQVSIEFSELTRSQLPALHLLQNLGYTYLPPREALALRGGRADAVLLEGVLLDWLAKHNEIQYHDQHYPFSEGNIHAAIQVLKETLAIGLLRTNETIFDLLSLGKSLQQSINGNLKSFGLHYIDWEHPENNVYHVAEEFAVERHGSHETRRPDLVLFVNGIPFCVIECKSPDIKDPIAQTISQQIRNQKEDEIPTLFQYAQLLLAVSSNEAKYATVGTPAKFWSVWKEENDEYEKTVKAVVDQPLSRSQIQALYYAFPGKHRMEATNSLNLPRVVTAQDRAIYSLCRPERLLELAYGFTLFDAWRKVMNEILSSTSTQPRCFTRVLKQKLFDTNPTCQICNQQIAEVDDAAVDHIEQYWLGGKTIPENARLTHRYCNWARSKKDVA